MSGIDWKSKIGKEFLYSKNKKYDGKDVSEIPDNELLVKLGGINQVANLRGFESVKIKLEHIDRDYVVAKCTIVWAESEIDGVKLKRQKFESVASAERTLVGDFMANYIETLAENRAFIRCVRRYLGINIVSEDEINKNFTPVHTKPDKEPEELPSPIRNLQKVMSSRGIETMDELKDFLRALDKKSAVNPEVAKASESWSELKDIDAKVARVLVGTLQNAK